VGSLWDILYDVLFQPRIAMRNIAEQKNIGQAAIVALVSILMPIWAVSFELKKSEMTTMIQAMIGVKVIGSLLVWIIGAAIWNLIAECFGGKGTGVGLFSALGFAHIPRVFMIPLWGLIAVMPASSKNVLMTLSVLIILCWSFALDVVAIKEVHQLSTAKAVLVMVTPMLILGLLCLIGFVYISSSLANMNMWI
jgi:hypothetical protein